MTMIDRDDLLKHEVMIITKGNASFHGVPSSLIETAPVIDLKNLQPVWRDPETDLPEAETEVLILYRRYGYLGITTAHYEDGNVFSEDSEWNWEDLSDWGTYDEERDDYRIPEGWWEYRHFDSDDVCNNKIDCTVVGWMPLPEKLKKEVVNNG